MNTAKSMLKMALLTEILRAAKLLEEHGLLAKNETAPDVVKRYVALNPDINEALEHLAQK